MLHFSLNSRFETKNILKFTFIENQQKSKKKYITEIIKLHFSLKITKLNLYLLKILKIQNIN